MAETAFGQSVIYGVGGQGAQPPRPANNPQGAQQPQPGNGQQATPQPRPADEPRPAPQQRPPANENPPGPPAPDGDAIPTNGRPRGGLGARRTLLLAAIALGALLSGLSLHRNCPAHMDQAACPRPRAAPPKARFDGGTDMFNRALDWLNQYQREARLEGPSDTMLTRKESAAVAERTENLYRAASKMKGAFTSWEAFEAQVLDALDARLCRARNDLSYFEGAKWPWLGRLACLPCDYSPLTLPCPSHPVTIARREAEAVTKALLLINSRYWELVKKHEAVEAEGLGPAHLGVCGVSDRLGNVNFVPGGQRGMRRLLDFRAAAFGACSLTEREQVQAQTFRANGVYLFMDEWRELMSRVNTISSRLDTADVSFSWSHEHINMGIEAVDGLLDVVNGQG